MAITNSEFTQEQVDAAVGYEAAEAEFIEGKKTWLYKGKPQVKKTQKEAYAIGEAKLRAADDRCREVGIDWMEYLGDGKYRWDFAEIVQAAIEAGKVT